MFFGKWTEIDWDVKLKHFDVKIEKVFETKFEGVIIDHKLTWRQLAKYINGKISKTRAILYKSEDILNYNALYVYVTYCSLTLPCVS